MEFSVCEVVKCNRERERECRFGYGVGVLLRYRKRGRQWEREWLWNLFFNTTMGNDTVFKEEEKIHIKRNRFEYE